MKKIIKITLSLLLILSAVTIISFAEDTSLETPLAEEVNTLVGDIDITSKFDSGLLSYLLNHPETSAIDTNQDGKLTDTEVSLVTSLNIEDTTHDYVITGFSGLEYFVNLEKLEIYFQNTTISNFDDVLSASFPKLKVFKLIYAKEGDFKLDFSANNFPELQMFELFETAGAVTDVNLSGLTNLQYVTLNQQGSSAENKMQTLTLKDNDSLRYLWVPSKKGMKKIINLEEAPNLELLNVNLLGTSDFNASTLSKLEYLLAVRVQNEWDFSKYPQMKNFNIIGNETQSVISFPSMPNLVVAHFQNAINVKEADLSANTQLVNIGFVGSQIKSLDLSKTKALDSTVNLPGVQEEFMGNNFVYQSFVSPGINVYFTTVSGKYYLEELILPTGFSGDINVFENRLETIEGDVNAINNVSLKGQKPYKAVQLNENDQPMITLSSKAVVDESTILLGGVYDATASTITWPSSVSIEDIITQQNEKIAFTSQLSGVSYFLEGVYELYEKLDPVTISISSSEGGVLSSTGEVSVEQGESKTITITPDEGYVIEKILVDGSEVEVSTSYTFENVTENHTFEVTFAKEKFTISVEVGVGGKASLEGDTVVAYGDDFMLSIQPDAGYEIDKIILDGIEVTPTESYILSNVVESHGIVVSFKAKQFDVVIRSNEFGTIKKYDENERVSMLTSLFKEKTEAVISADIETTLLYGEVLEIAIVPIKGNEVVGVLINNENQSQTLVDELNASHPYTLTGVQQNLDIVVLFGKIQEGKPSMYYTVNFNDCSGNLIAQDWVQMGETAKGPSGYTYDLSEIQNISNSKDVDPLNCSGGFAIPTTGR